MSSTIERRLSAIVRAVAISFALAATWVGASAALLAATERAEAVTVFFTEEAGAFELPSSVRLLEWDGRSGRFVGYDPGYVRDLYRAGALLVLPVRSSGCLALSA